MVFKENVKRGAFTTVEAVRDIVVTVNGTKYRVLDPDPKLSLNDWLRNHLHLKGTKILCGEGGCGSCVVAVSKDDPVTHPQSIKSVNSCLCPLLSLDGHHVITVEGLGGKRDGFHVIQKRFAEKFASQCGFCTPGFVMSGFSLLASSSEGKTEKEIEDCFDGNICRCTGYRPIMDAMKSFANACDPVDIEDLTKQSCKKTCAAKKAKVISHSGLQRSDSLWFSPHSLMDLYCVLAKFNGKRVKLVSGNTGIAIYKDEPCSDVLVDIRALKELAQIELKDAYVSIGAAVTLTQMANFMEKNSKKSESFQVLANHIKKIANVPVRNVATWAGNLMLKHRHQHFASDIYLLLAAVGAELVIADVNGNIIKCNLEEFMQVQMGSKVILSVTLPFSRVGEFFQTEKIMPRKQTAFAYVNAAFRASLDSSSISFKEKPTIIIGGLGLKMVRATKCEEFLTGKNIEKENVFTDAVNLLEESLQANPEDKVLNFSYCKNVAINLFYK